MIQKSVTVVLVHGFAASPYVMVPLGKRLNRHGYATLNWGYNSFSGSIEAHGVHLADVLKELDRETGTDTIHLVGHSMGTAVIRCALKAFRPTKLGRLVLVTPPTKGVRIASWIGPKLKGLAGTIDELADRPDSFIKTLPALEGVEVGVIAARFDHLIRPSETHMLGQTDYLVVNTVHTAVLFGSCQTAVVRFLETGRFRLAKG